jgi:hypothetical protein
LANLRLALEFRFRLFRLVEIRSNLACFLPSGFNESNFSPDDVAK